MAKSKDRVQAYRLTMEFTLRDRGDYTLVTQTLRRVLLDTGEQFIGYVIDYIAVEKVPEPMEEPKRGN